MSGKKKPRSRWHKCPKCGRGFEALSDGEPCAACKDPALHALCLRINRLEAKHYGCRPGPRLAKTQERERKAVERYNARPAPSPDALEWMLSAPVSDGGRRNRHMPKGEGRDG